MADQDLNIIIAGGKYHLIVELGQGGMGVVYGAEQLGKDGQILREVAVKRLNWRGLSNPTARRRFPREIQIMAKLNHPHIVTLYDAGEDSEGLYYVMGLVRGPTLEEILGCGRPLPSDRVVTILDQICDALSEIHNLPDPVIHRDLKPGNIFIEKRRDQDWVLVSDFGIAKILDDLHSGLTSPGTTPGSPEYMAPEQIRGEVIDQRTDLYALGVVAYEMLQGNKPFTASDPATLLRKHLNEPPPPLPASVPEQLRQLVHRLLEKNPSDRPATAEEVRQHLRGEGTRLITIEPPADVFISYAPEDTGPVMALKDQLESAGVRVALDRSKAPSTSGCNAETERKIKNSRLVLMACSDASLRSPAAKAELLTAWTFHRPLLPVLVGKTSFPEQVEYWREIGWGRVLDVPLEQQSRLILSSLAHAGIRCNSEFASPLQAGEFVEPVRPDSGLHGLRLIAQLTDQIWPMAAQRARDRASIRGGRRGMGAPQPDVQHGYYLNDPMCLAIEWERGGHLLLLDIGTEGINYCLCPSRFARNTYLPPACTVELPQRDSPYPSFILTGKPGREHLLAIITEKPLGLDWMPKNPKEPARALTAQDIDDLLTHLHKLDASEWTALATSFEIREKI